jgi:hypothetical protein
MNGVSPGVRGPQSWPRCASFSRPSIRSRRGAGRSSHDLSRRAIRPQRSKPADHRDSLTPSPHAQADCGALRSPYPCPQKSPKSSSRTSAPARARRPFGVPSLRSAVMRARRRGPSVATDMRQAFGRRPSSPPTPYVCDGRGDAVTLRVRRSKRTRALRDGVGRHEEFPHRRDERELGKLPAAMSR